MFWAQKGGLWHRYTHLVCVCSVDADGLARGHNVGAFKDQVMERKFIFFSATTNHKGFLSLNGNSKRSYEVFMDAQVKVEGRTR